MAEGILRHDGGDAFEVFSAGLNPSFVRPEAIRAMSEIGIDISTHRSSPLGAFAGDGQREGDGSAEADSRLGADLPAVGFDQAFGYGQPKPGASGLGAGHRQEAVEESREIFRENAVPRVGD